MKIQTKIINLKKDYLFSKVNKIQIKKKDVNILLNCKIERLIQEYNLGNEIKSIEKVSGGLSHRMYKVETNKGIYAVKELNSGVMKREKAYSNFVFSEKVADIAKKNGISAIGALKLNNDIMLKIDGSYFMVFEWIEGRILKTEEITEKHCEIIGKMLAQIHRLHGIGQVEI